MLDWNTLLPNPTRSGMSPCLYQKMNEGPQWLTGTDKFAPGGVSIIGGEPDIENGLLRLGSDPRLSGAQADAQAAYDNEVSRADLLTIAESASRTDQANRAAAALMLKQAQEGDDAQRAPWGVSGGPRRQVAVSMYPRAPGLLARLRASAKPFQGGR